DSNIRFPELRPCFGDGRAVKNGSCAVLDEFFIIKVHPNVFQICALRDMGTERERRQTIGRGLRLCVNQKGQRLRGFDINTLTVIATESYEQFAENLQKEIEKDTGIRFGIVEKHQFATLVTTDEK
ncbi:unnamed protein product, partial [marine sediment metagenome]